MTFRFMLLLLAMVTGAPLALLSSGHAAAAVTSQPRTLAFASGRGCARENQPAGSDIYTVEQDGSGLVQLTHDCLSGDPVWSPDGARIAYASTRDGSVAVYVMNADGSHVQRLSPTGLWATKPAWSRTNRIAFVVDYAPESPGSIGIWTIAADGTDARHLTAYGDRPSWSADGQLIAFTDRVHADSHSQPAMAVMRADGTNLTTIGYGEGPTFAPDGRHLAWVSSDYPVDQNSKITVGNTDGSGGRVIATLPLAQDLAWAPDSSMLAYDTSVYASNQEVYVISAAGGSSARVTVHAAADGDADWRPAIPSTGLVISRIAFRQGTCATRDSVATVIVSDAQGRPLAGSVIELRGGLHTVRATTNAAGTATLRVAGARRHRGRLALTVTSSMPGRATAVKRISIPVCR